MYGVFQKSWVYFDSEYLKNYFGYHNPSNIFWKLAVLSFLWNVQRCSMWTLLITRHTYSQFVQIRNYEIIVILNAIFARFFGLIDDQFHCEIQCIKIYKAWFCLYVYTYYERLDSSKTIECTNIKLWVIDHHLGMTVIKIPLTSSWRHNQR